MKSEADQYLAEAQAIVDRVQREKRGITPDERRRAEAALERVGDIKDNEALQKAISDMNGQLNMARSPSKSRGAPALDFSMKQVSDMQAAALSGHFMKAAIDSTKVPQSEVATTA